MYVVIGRRTFSSAILNARDFKRETKAILIGEETAGKPNHYGQVKHFLLPSSKIDVSYSTRYFSWMSGDPSTLEPDIECELTFANYLNGIDPVYEMITKIKK